MYSETMGLTFYWFIIIVYIGLFVVPVIFVVVLVIYIQNVMEKNIKNEKKK